MWLTINTKTKTVAREVVSKVALIGDFNEWKESEEPEFTYNAAKNVWESPVISFTEGKEWLLRLNGSWEHKYGDAVATTDIAGGFELTKGKDAKTFLLLEQVTISSACTPTGHRLW